MSVRPLAAQGSPGSAPRKPAASVVRWMGNKRAHADLIADVVASVADAGSLVVDPFAGSQVVPLRLKRRQRFVTSDAQHVPAVIGRAFVDNTSLRALAPETIERLAGVAADRLRCAPPGFLERTYADTWFDARQCRALDALRAAVDVVTPDPEDPRRALALCGLIVAACRAQASPGHFAQYLPPDHARTQRLRSVDVRSVALEAMAGFDVLPGLAGSRSFALDWRALVAAHGGELREAAAWYLDPPYTRDQYSRFYHLLETLVLADEPAVGGERARYRVDRFRSDFCRPRAAPQELRDLLSAVRLTSPAARIVLSYSARGLLSRDDIPAAASGLYSVTAFRELEHAYSTQGQGRLSGVIEWLVVLEPRPAR